MGDLIEITTRLKDLNSFYKITSNALSFEVMAVGNAAIGLSRKPSHDCDYWIYIGDRQQCWIKKQDSHLREITNTPGILSGEEYRRFCIIWDNGHVRLGRNGYSDTIVSCANDIPDLKYVTFSVIEQRNRVHWRFEVPPVAEKIKHRAITEGELKWVPFIADQELPSEPLVAGFETERVYIARAMHEGSLTPGTYVPSVGKAFVPWGGHANEKEEFEVLCGFDGIWKPAFEDKIPAGAFIANYSEHARERLYIGRVEHEGHLIPGKVVPSHKVCYISYQGREIGSKTYEVLVIPNKNARCVNKILMSNRYYQAETEDNYEDDISLFGSDDDE